MGGDFAPDSAIKGAGLAANELPDGTSLVLIGNEQLIEQKLKEYGISNDKIEVTHAPDVIEMGEHPTKALSQKPKASIPVGFNLLKQGSIQAFAGAGNTGAMHVGAMFTIKAIEGIAQ